MNTYRAYGIAIASETPLPPLPATDEPPEVTVRPGRVDAARPPTRRTSVTFRGDTREGVLVMADVACIHVREGREIVVESAHGADEDAVRALLLGPALAILMNQRGMITLHASAIAFDGRAVAFMGDAGWGKSTLAAAFHRRGHPLVADDIVAVTFADGRPHALPAVPQLKLAPDAMAALGGDPARLPRVWSGTEKRLQVVQDGFVTATPVLSRVYLLAPEARNGIAPVTSPEATIEFVRHSFAVRVLHQTEPARYLQDAARLAESVQVVRLGRPLGVDQVEEAADAVEADLAGAS